MDVLYHIYESDYMNRNKIRFGNFKCLYKPSFEPGKVNVRIDANGSGKSTILEGTGLGPQQRLGQALEAVKKWQRGFEPLNADTNGNGGRKQRWKV